MEKLEIIKLIVAGILALYEVTARLIPTEGKWSILHKILSILGWISDKLDNAGDKKEARQAKALEREKIKLEKLKAKSINKIK
jgi:hypothetical protein